MTAPELAAPGAAELTAAEDIECTGEVRLLANTVVGLGFSRRGFAAGLAQHPHLIGCDAGSSDFGPYYLGSGLDPKSSRAVRRDLQIMLEGARELGVPLVIGSCGGAGGDPHLAGYAAVVREIAADLGLRFRLATISAEQPRERLHAKLTAGRIRPLGGAGALTPAEIDATVRTVAMMGVEPIVAALDGGADVVLSGRTADPAIYAGVALRLGIDPGTAWLAAKTIDKGALATTAPGEGSPVLARLRAGRFAVAPCKPGVTCTVRTVGAMTMHENPDPLRIVEPGGVLDTSAAEYVQQPGGSVRVRGGRFEPADPYTVKLEGAAPVGYRTLLLAGLRDHRVIERLDEFLDRYRALIARAAHSMGIDAGQYTLNFRCYGRDAVLGEREPDGGPPPREVGLVVDVVADTEEMSRAIAARLGPTGSRLDVTGGRLGGGGNFAYPFSPSVVPVGPVFRWSVWHTMQVDPAELPAIFPIRWEEL